VVYPDDLPQRRWFAFYAQHFLTVEINNTFYRLPPEETFRQWAAQAPPGFLYAVKASQFITHVRRLRAPQEPLERLLSRSAALGDHRGPILFQLPARWHCDLERLQGFLAALPDGPSYVMEFRDPSWLNEEVYALLRAHGVGLCIAHAPGWMQPLVTTTRVVYLRFHGTHVLYGDSYDDATLAQWAQRILAWHQAGQDVYAYFNNDAFGYAFTNAAHLQQVLRQLGRGGCV